MWNRYAEDKVIKVGWRTVVSKSFELPDGQKHTYETIDAVGTQTAAVLAVTKDDRIVVARQFRPGPEKYMDELPGGAVDEGEEPAVAAIRELREETGYVSDDLPEFIGTVHPGAYSNTTRNYYILRNCYLGSEQELDTGELVEVRLATPAEVLDNARKARMTDMGAVLLAYEELMELSDTEIGGSDEATN